jgi:hypothetical protein
MAKQMKRRSNTVLVSLIGVTIMMIAGSLFGCGTGGTPAPSVAVTHPPTLSPKVAVTPSAIRPGITYTVADVDKAEARWNSKKVDTYHIEVWTGGITPPPPVYIVQLWKGKIVFAATDSRMSETTPRLTPLDPNAQAARAVTVPGLFAKARELLTSGSTGSGGSRVDAEISARFDDEWGYPNEIRLSANCPDCAWLSQVRRFAAFDSTAPPATPTPRQ